VVRWKGGHVHQAYLTGVLGEFFEFVPVCPEVEVGMGVPRPTIRLELHDDRTRLIDPKHGIDWTAAMTKLARTRTGMVDESDLSGFILKKDSPTCGPWRVKRYESGHSTRQGVGMFAAALLERYPLLPIEDEGRLNDPALRENFIERVFAFRRLERLFSPRWTYGDVVAFHTREKLLVRSHDDRRYRDLGRLVADGKPQPRVAFSAHYSELFMEALGVRATVRKNTNVLQHIAGHFKGIDEDSTRHELAGLIEDYRLGLVPLVVPVTLIRHLVRRFDVAVLADQTYLEPHPKELMLRNHA
jgi:uncharacterized protein YbgA (DUF1722 family)/uncharacterized protein YbbK (DUF523 family)